MKLIAILFLLGSSLPAWASELEVFERILSDAELSATLRTVRVRTQLEVELEIPALGGISLTPEVELYFSME